jgi:LPS O-antigen subunit length determinant protein (WzzB/FepE family)
MDGHLLALRRWWWVAGVICAIASAIATAATAVATRDATTAAIVHEIAVSRADIVASSVRLDALTISANVGRALHAGYDEHFARIEAVLGSLTAGADRMRDDLAALRQQQAVEHERVAFLFDRVAPVKTVGARR